MSNAIVIQGSRSHGLVGVCRVPPHGDTGRGDRVGSIHPNYALRRVLALFLAVVVVVLLATAMSGLPAGFGGGPASASEAQSARPQAEYHLAQPGDSLWAIATEYHGAVSINSYLDAMINLNGGTVIVPGQAVWLP